MSRMMSFPLPFLVVLIMAVVTLTIGQHVEFFADYKNNHKEDEIDYSFLYSINHPSSGVALDHWEGRKGQHVTGRYGVLEPTGLVRTVYYEVNGNSGFKSVVRIRTPGSVQNQKIYSRSKIAQPKHPIQFLKPVAYVT